MATDRKPSTLVFEGRERKKKRGKIWPTGRTAPYAGAAASGDDVCGFVREICE